jgi:hypothetical protein
MGKRLPLKEIRRERMRELLPSEARSREVEKQQSEKTVYGRRLTVDGG